MDFLDRLHFIDYDGKRYAIMAFNVAEATRQIEWELRRQSSPHIYNPDFYRIFWPVAASQRDELH